MISPDDFTTNKTVILVGGFTPPEKYESQIGSTSQLLGKIKAMFQSTNQVIGFPPNHNPKR